MPTGETPVLQRLRIARDKTHTRRRHITSQHTAPLPSPPFPPRQLIANPLPHHTPIVSTFTVGHSILFYFFFCVSLPVWTTRRFSGRLTLCEYPPPDCGVAPPVLCSAQLLMQALQLEAFGSHKLEEVKPRVANVCPSEFARSKFANLFSYTPHPPLTHLPPTRFKLNPHSLRKEKERK